MYHRERKEKVPVPGKKMVLVTRNGYKVPVPRKRTVPVPQVYRKLASVLESLDRLERCR